MFAKSMYELEPSALEPILMVIVCFFSQLTPSMYPYLECYGDLISRLIMGIIWVIKWLIGVINLLTKSP